MGMKFSKLIAIRNDLVSHQRKTEDWISRNPHIHKDYLANDDSDTFDKRLTELINLKDVEFRLVGKYIKELENTHPHFKKNQKNYYMKKMRNE